MTLRRRSREADLAALAALAREYGVEEVVVGLPLRLDGSPGPEAERVVRWARRLEAGLGLPVRYWDERLTTAAAERALLAADLSRRRRRRIVDRTAACLILQGYLDRRQVQGAHNKHGARPDPEGESASAGDVDRYNHQT